jgi:outer membrane protein OmpA-like peptidoglycan-associated protein
MMLLFAASVILPSSLLAQSGKSVIFPSRNISITTALNEIERQAGYDIAVNWENVDTVRLTTLSANQLSVESTLNDVLAGTNLKWEITGNTIAIVNGDEPLYSTMNRNRLPDRMVVVPDPYSTRQISEEEIARIANGYWRSDNDDVTDSLGLVTLNFRMNSTTLESDYMDNAQALDMIFRTFSDKQMLADMDFITVIAASSPDGNTAANDKLAAARAKAVKSYVMWKYPFMNRERIFTFSIGEDWTGLRKMVSEDKKVPYHNEVLKLLDSEQEGDVIRSELKRIGGGSAYRYIADNMLPRLRGAAACMIYYKQKPEPVITTERITDTVYVEREVRRDSIIRVEVPTRKPYYWALKTNLLYDALLLPDLHAEFSIGRRWSVELGGQWAWWTSNKSHDNTWRIQTAGLEGRYWLGNRESKTRLSGHFLGVYGMVGTYDVRFGAKTGYLSDMSYSAGISYGYSTRLSRSLNLELGISVGYMGGEYETYHIYDEEQNIFYRDGQDSRHYFGPTKARVSLVWLLDGKNPAKKR